ncbi:MAG: hypothetical protein ACK4PR_05410, partial [Gammaproteobacteria bacterium]
MAIEYFKNNEPARSQFKQLLDTYVFNSKEEDNAKQKTTSFMSGRIKDMPLSELNESCARINQVITNLDNPEDSLQTISLIFYLNRASMKDINADTKKTLINTAAELFHNIHANLISADYKTIFTLENINPEIVVDLIKQVYELSKKETTYTANHAVVSNITKSTHVINNILQIINPPVKRASQRVASESAISNRQQTISAQDRANRFSAPTISAIQVMQPDASWDLAITKAQAAMNSIALNNEQTKQAAEHKLHAELIKLNDFSELNQAIKSLETSFLQQMPQPGTEVQQAMKHALVIQQRKVEIAASLNEHTTLDAFSLATYEQLKKNLLTQKAELITNDPQVARTVLENFRKECQQLFTTQAKPLNTLIQQKESILKKIDDNYMEVTHALQHSTAEYANKINEIATKCDNIIDNILKEYTALENSLDKNAKETAGLVEKIDNFIDKLDNAAKKAAVEKNTITAAETVLKDIQHKLQSADNTSASAVTSSLANIKSIVDDLQTQLEECQQLLKENKKSEADFSVADASFYELQEIGKQAAKAYAELTTRLATTVANERSKYAAILPDALQQVAVILDKTKLVNQNTLYKELTSVAEACSKALPELTEKLSGIEQLQKNTANEISKFEKEQGSFAEIKQKFTDKKQSITNEIAHAIKNAKIERLSNIIAAHTRELRNEINAIQDPLDAAHQNIEKIVGINSSLMHITKEIAAQDKRTDLLSKMLVGSDNTILKDKILAFRKTITTDKNQFNSLKDAINLASAVAPHTMDEVTATAVHAELTQYKSHVDTANDYLSTHDLDNKKVSSIDVLEKEVNELTQHIQNIQVIRREKYDFTLSNARIITSACHHQILAAADILGRHPDSENHEGLI